ncbi:MAG: class D beta-lactamase [Bdellovibrionaceae bacterium]|jgi:beta-lactamase class D|nr:class D beta-lactamase [Pseudobdellovibrionaceae bacterium]
MIKLIISLLAIIPFFANAEVKLPKDMGTYFNKNHSSCFLIKRVGGLKVQSFNMKQCDLRNEPYSTFKILNSLIGLETAAINSLTIIPWDKKKKFLKAWEKDHTLKSAIKNSVVPFYQELARRINLNRMQKYINLVDYGNKKVGDRIDRFWLDGPIQISASEQLNFIEKLYRNQLPFKKEHQSFVKEILINEKGPSRILSGKTGSKYKKGHFVFGWFVGHVRKGKDQYVFVINSKGQGESGSRLKSVAISILQDMGL